MFITASAALSIDQLRAMPDKGRDKGIA